MLSKERKTADALVSAFNALDPAAIIALRTASCTRVILPQSLEHQPQSNDRYLANLTAMRSIFTTFKVSVNDVIEGTSIDEKGHSRTKIVMFVNARGDTPVGEYKNEYVWRMAFEEDEDGEAKISEWSEYVDVGMARDFYPRLIGEVRRRAAEKEASVKVQDSSVAS